MDKSVIKELEEKLQSLDPKTAENLTEMVRRAMQQVDKQSDSGWPEGYFEATAGSFSDQPLERGPQGELPQREKW